MLSIDKSGNLRWYRQITPHDLFDYDFEASPILATAAIGGSPRRIVLGAGKAGHVVAFDADTGDVLWDVTVGVHKNDTVTSLRSGGAPLVVSPGFVGGVMSPMALSDDVLYVPVADTVASYTPTNQIPSLAGTGELVALDVGTGRTVWKASLNVPVYAAATVVSDLVLTATVKGRVVAFDRRSGTQVWSWQAPGGIDAPIAAAGDSLFVPVGAGPAPKVVGLSLSGG